MKPKLLETKSAASGYSLAEAEKMLPLIAAIAAEIAERQQIRRGLHKTRAELEQASSPEGFGNAIAELNERAFTQTDGIHGAIDELVELGLTVLRLSPVTIHIPGRSVSGPLVFCWQVGDTNVSHGHRIGEEDDPRRPLRVRAPNGFRG